MPKTTLVKSITSLSEARYCSGMMVDYISFDLNPESVDYVPKNGDKVFFLPGVNVPRIKFKNLCDESGIRTVRDATKANVFIANNNTHLFVS
jgi:hypothetical protein